MQLNAQMKSKLNTHVAAVTQWRREFALAKGKKIAEEMTQRKRIVKLVLVHYGRIGNILTQILKESVYVGTKQAINNIIAILIQNYEALIMNLSKEQKRNFEIVKVFQRN